MDIKNHLNMLSMVLKQKKNKIEVALKFQQISLKFKNKSLLDKIFRKSIIFDGCIILNKEDGQDEINQRKFIINMFFRQQPTGSIMIIFLLKSFILRFVNIK